jgi:hypothetical protein
MKFRYHFQHLRSGTTGTNTVDCDSKLDFLIRLNKWNTDYENRYKYWSDNLEPEPDLTTEVKAGLIDSINADIACLESLRDVYVIGGKDAAGATKRFLEYYLKFPFTALKS